jgi:transcriptional regulator with XRE-family HTH domain
MKKPRVRKNQNRLALFRRKRGYSQLRVAHLLGHKSHGALSSYEQGRALPTLLTALRLEIVLRTPVAFLFPDVYDSARFEIRAEEERMSGTGQLDLFDNSTLQL